MSWAEVYGAGWGWVHSLGIPLFIEIKMNFKDVVA